MNIISNKKPITIASIFHSCESVFIKNKRNSNENSTISLFTIIPTTSPAIWRYSGEKSDRLPVFMECIQWIHTVAWKCIELIRIFTSCHWEKSFKVRDIFPLLYPKKSRFSSLEIIIVFCITYLETEFASHPEWKVCSIVWELES